jgi:hypothetical protein
MSIEEKLLRIKELQSEIQRLSREIENEFYTPARLKAFEERYRTMKRVDIVPLITLGHAAYDEDFARCFRYCLERQIGSFAPLPSPTHNPPLPVDEKFGPPPTVDFESRKAAADQIRDQLLAQASEEPKERREAEQEGFSRDGRISEIAAQTADFNQRSENARKITSDLSARTSCNESREHTPVVETSREAVLERIATENAELEKRRQAANRIKETLLSDSL